MDFSGAVARADVPVVSHETGQFQVYPDYREIAKYTGVLYPYNMEVFRDRLARAGMSEQAEDFFLASGRWAAELYKADIEMDLRTEGLAGFQLLDLQDYPGQGSAYVGILDAFMDSKGLVSPERWRGFCNEVVPLLLTEKFCWTEGETLTARVKVAHYGARSLQGTELAWTLRDEQGHVAGKGVCPIVSSGRGLLEVGDIRQPIPVTGKARRLNLELAIEGTDYKNTYPLWFYPENRSAEESHPGITVVKRLDGHVLSALENGGMVSRTGLLCLPNGRRVVPDRLLELQDVRDHQPQQPETGLSWDDGAADRPRPSVVPFLSYGFPYELAMVPYCEAELSLGFGSFSEGLPSHRTGYRQYRAEP